MATVFYDRKNPRLKEYDYSKPGYYFVTVNAAERGTDIFGKLSLEAVRADDHIGPLSREMESPTVELTHAGKIVRDTIEGISNSYSNVFVDEYAVMPDHVHMIVEIRNPEDGPMWSSALTANSEVYNKTIGTTKSSDNLISIIRTLKTLSTKKAGFSLWQRSFFEHIIRNDEDLLNTRNYIRYNAAKHYYLTHPEGHDTHA